MEGIKYGRGTVDTLDKYRATEKIRKMAGRYATF